MPSASSILRLTPGRFVAALLAVEVVFWLSEPFRLFPFNSHKGWTVLIAVACVGVFLPAMTLGLIGARLFRLRFQFSLRTLIALTVVAALPLSWLAVEMKNAREQREVVASIRNMSASPLVTYDWESNPPPSRNPPGAAWLRNLLGDDFFAEVTMVHLTGHGVWFGMQWVPVPDQPGKGSWHEKQWVQVPEQHESTDAMLEHLKGLTALEELGLIGTNVTDAGLEQIRGLTALKYLYLYNTRVTDAGLEHLKGLTALRRLGIGGTKVTGDGSASVGRALPSCTIVWY